MATIAAPARVAAMPRMGVVAFLTASMSAWRQRRALAKLDDRARRDLGLAQSDVLRETARPIWDVPTAWRA